MFKLPFWLPHFVKPGSFFIYGETGKFFSFTVEASKYQGQGFWNFLKLKFSQYFGCFPRIYTLRISSVHNLIIFFSSHIFTLKLYFLSKFQSYNIVLSTIVTMLYIRASDLIHLEVSILLPGSPHFPYSQALGNYFSSPCFNI